MNYECTAAIGFLDVQEFLKGVMKELWRIPAFQRSFSDPNIRKMIHCRCWPLWLCSMFLPLLKFFLGYKNLMTFGSTRQMCIFIPRRVSYIEQDQKSSTSCRILIFTNVLWTRMWWRCLTQQKKGLEPNRTPNTVWWTSLSMLNWINSDELGKFLSCNVKNDLLFVYDND